MSFEILNLVTGEKGIIGKIRNDRLHGRNLTAFWPYNLHLYLNSFIGIIPSVPWQGNNFVDHIHSLCYLAKDGVFFVQRRDI